jgi:hypothetical protein
MKLLGTMAAALAFSAGTGAALAETADRAMKAGDWVTLVLTNTTHKLCARVHQIADGADGQPWAWVQCAYHPGVVFHVPVVQLSAGCEK